MIMVFLTACDKQGNVNQFACGLDSVEAVFDFLDEVVSQGDTLLTAYMLDQLERNKRMDLPLEAFDGIPSSIAIKELQEEWQAILTDPEPHEKGPAHDEATIQLIRQRLRQYQMRIATSERMVNCFTKLLQRLQATSSLGPTRDGLMHQYKTILERSEKQLVKAQFRSNVVTHRLNLLLA